MFDGPLGVNPQNPGGVRPGRFVQPRSIPLCRRAMFCPAARRCHLPEPGGELGGGSTGSGGVEVLSALMFPNAGRPPRHPDRKRGSNGRPWSVGLLGSLFDIQKQTNTHTPMQCLYFHCFAFPFPELSLFQGSRLVRFWPSDGLFAQTEPGRHPKSLRPPPFAVDRARHSQPRPTVSLGPTWRVLVWFPQPSTMSSGRQETTCSEDISSSKCRMYMDIYIYIYEFTIYAFPSPPNRGRIN